MKNTVLFFIASCVAIFIISSCNTNTNEKTAKGFTNNEEELIPKPDTTPIIIQPIKSINQNSNSINLNFLKKLNGKYPYEVKLFENNNFSKRLKNLIGVNRFNFLKEYWAVENPMEINDSLFVTNGCQAHNCGGTNFIIMVDFIANTMYAGIREEGEAKTYSEDGSNSKQLIDWVNYK